MRPRSFSRDMRLISIGGYFNVKLTKRMVSPKLKVNLAHIVQE